MRASWLSLALLLGCAHDQAQPVWAPTTTIRYATSHRCTPQGCTCRDPDAPGDQEEQNPPKPGMKRFELRLDKTPDRIWVDVERLGVIFKESDDLRPVCAYVDLPAGNRTRIRYHMESRRPGEGTTLALDISEYGAAGPWWYDTARILCGKAAIPCDPHFARRWLAEMQALPRGLRDPCGSTKIENPQWQATEYELVALPMMTVGVDLNVYKFAPRSPPGAKECAGDRQPAPVETAGPPTAPPAGAQPEGSGKSKTPTGNAGVPRER